MSSINFNEIENNKNVEFKSNKVEPGVGVFTIADMEFKDNVNNKRYAIVTYTNEEEKSFKAMYYVTTASGWARIKELATSAGVEFGQETEETVVAKLIGKRTGLIVDGVTEFVMVDEKVKTDAGEWVKTGNKKQIKVTNPELRFVGFSFDPKGVHPSADSFRIKDTTVGAQAKPQTVPPSDEGADDDLPF